MLNVLKEGVYVFFNVNWDKIQAILYLETPEDRAFHWS